MEKFKIKNIHLAIIIFGIIFNCIGIFHSNLWFDEAYSVGLASNTFKDIWTIGGNDVHPVLYYWVLHIIYLLVNLFGASTNITIICYRVFSLICVAIVGILGYTHIRKDFGERVGALFSLFTYFLPIVCIYSAEVRMYSLAFLLVTILAIYAYRISKYRKTDTPKINVGAKKEYPEEKCKSKLAIKNWIIFEITSLLCIYTHYYALMAAGIINCVLLIKLIKQKRKVDIITIIVSGLIQAIAYIPWIMCFVGQLKHVAKGFWIKFEFPKTIMQISSSQFIGNIKDEIGFIFSIIFYAYLIYKVCKLIKNKEQCKPAICSILIYTSVILVAGILGIVMKTSILYYRYVFAITGIYIFFISYILEKEKNKFIITILCGITLILGAWSNYNQINEVYDKSNNTAFSYLEQRIQPNDVIIFTESNYGSGIVIGMKFEDNKKYFYNPSYWDAEEAYKAFGENLKVCTNNSFYQELPNRIWIIDSPNADYYNEVFKNDQYKLISQYYTKVKYENYDYNIILIEKISENINNDKL